MNCPIYTKASAPLGIGNTFTSVADDKNSLFDNQAGLSKLSKPIVSIVDPLIEVYAKAITLA